MAKSLVLVTRVNILPKRLKISKHTNLRTVAKSLMLVTIWQVKLSLLLSIRSPSAQFALLFLGQFSHLLISFVDKSELDRAGADL